MAWFRTLGFYFYFLCLLIAIKNVEGREVFIPADYIIFLPISASRPLTAPAPRGRGCLSLSPPVQPSPTEAFGSCGSPHAHPVPNARSSAPQPLSPSRATPPQGKLWPARHTGAAAGGGGSGARPL